MSTAGAVGKAPRRGKCQCSFCELQAVANQCEKINDQFVCPECVEFAATSGYETKALAVMKGKSPAKWKDRKAQKDEWKEGKAVEAGQRGFEGEDVYEETVQESSLIEEFTFLPRDDFKDENGCLPDQAKVMTLRVTNAKGEDSFGVVVLQDVVKPPTLKVCTTRRLIRRKPILKAATNYYKAQASTLFENLSSDRARAYGQRFGNKYQPKAKKFTAYSKQIISAHVKKHFLKSKGLRRLVEGGGAANDDGSNGDGSSEAGDSDEGEGAAAAPSAPSAAAAPQAAASAASGQPAEAAVPETPKASRTSAPQAASGPKPTREDVAADSPAATLAPSAKKAKTRTAVAPSVADSSATLCDVDGRLKHPDYWYNTLTTSKAFAGVSLKRNVAWAKDCAKRMATQGEAVAANHLAEHIAAVELCMQLVTDLGHDKSTFGDLKDILSKIVEAKVDFDSNIKSKLLGKRLYSSVIAFGDEDADDSSIHELVSIMMPFKAEPPQMDHESIAQVSEDVVMEVSIEEFDPLSVSMATIDGTLDTRFALLLSVLLKEIIPAVMVVEATGQAASTRLCAAMLAKFEAGVEDEAEIPPTAVDALNVLRVMCALCDPTANMDFEVLEEFYAAQGKKTKGALADLGVVLRSNEHWKPTYDELHRTLQDAKQWIPKMFKCREAIAGLKRNFSEFKLPNPTVMEAFTIIKSIRSTLRTGSSHVLEVACSGLLGVILDSMFDNSGVKQHGNGYSRDELTAAQKLFDEGVTLKPITEEFGLKAVADINAVIEAAGAREVVDGLLGKMTAGVKGASGNIEPELLRSILFEAQAVQGAAITDTNKATIATFCAGVWDAIKSDVTSDNGELAEMTIEIAGIAGDNPIKGIFSAFFAAVEAQVSMDAHVEACSGEGEGKGVTDEVPMNKMSTIMSKKLALGKALAETIGDQRATRMKDVDDAVNSYVDAQADVAMTQLETAVSGRVDATSTWAKGHADGSLWWQSVSDASDLDEVLQRAAETVVETKADRYLDEKTELENLVKQYDDVASVFIRATKGAVKAKAQEVCAALAQSYIEGLICALFLHGKYSKEDKKKKVHTIKMMAGRMKAKWQAMPSALLLYSAKALKLQ